MAFKHYLLFAFTACIAICIFCACKKTVTIPPKAQLTVNINADSTSFNLASSTKPTTFSAMAFTSGSMVVNSFIFDAVKNGKALETITPGTGVVDLFTTSPNGYTITLDTGVYSNAVIKVKVVKSTTAIASMILKGTYTPPTGNNVPIEVDFNENSMITLKVKDQLVVDVFSDFTSSLKLYLNKLFKGVASTDVDKATLTNGTLLISSTINKNIYAKIKANILYAAGGDVVQIVVED